MALLSALPGDAKRLARADRGFPFTQPRDGTQPKRQALSRPEHLFDLVDVRMATAADAVAAMGSVVQGVADGDLTQRDAAQLAAVIQAFARTPSTAEVERKLRKLVEAPG